MCFKQLGIVRLDFDLINRFKHEGWTAKDSPRNAKLSRAPVKAAVPGLARPLERDGPFRDPVCSLRSEERSTLVRHCARDLSLPAPTLLRRDSALSLRSIP